ncbi:hypothetical protein TNCV_256491 [Trichonephila clavipes]|nr:hypothetical protein TNCV_256491 [Trichonephila clavipes]
MLNGIIFSTIQDNNLLRAIGKFLELNHSYFQKDSITYVTISNLDSYDDNAVNRLDWCVPNPDLNPMENLWDELDSRRKGITAPIKYAALDAHTLTPRLEWCRPRGNSTAVELNQVVCVSSDESRFNISSDDNRVRLCEKLMLNSSIRYLFTETYR